MNIYTKDLVELSNIDKALDSYTPQIKQINTKVTAAQEKVNELAAQKEDIAKVIENNSSKIKSFEIQIQELKDQLKSIKKKQALVKTEREISSLSSEEHIAKETMSYNNDEIERLDKINDVKTQELEDLEGEFTQANEALTAIQSEVEKELQGIEKQKASLYGKRDESIRSMDQKILAFYEKIRKWAGVTAVVKVQKQACYGCYMKINDKTYSDLIRGDDIVTCPHCGRVLYIELDSENEEA